MTVNSLIVIKQLQELEQQVAQATPHAESLRDAWRRQDRQAFLCATLDAERHVCAMAQTTGCLKAQVVPADGLGDGLESLSELVLRAVRMVLLAELNVLREVVNEPSACGRSRALVTRPFRTPDRR